MPKKKTLDELLEEALVPEEEQPYEIPKNWVWTRIGIVNDIITGSTPPKKNPEYYGGNFPFIKPPDLQQNLSIQEVSSFLSEKGEEKIRKIPVNSTLICCIGSIGKVGLNKFTCSTNQQINSLIPKGELLNPLFNYYYSLDLNFQNELINRSSSTTVSILNKSKLSKIPIPLPPHKEQKRIADKVKRLLNKVDQAKQLIEEVKETFEKRRASILDKAFRGELTEKWRRNNLNIKFNEQRNVSHKESTTSAPATIKEPSDLPQGWKWVKLSDILQVNPPKKKLNNVPDNQTCSFIPMASVSDQNGKTINIQERGFELVKKGYTYIENNDVIFAKITPCMENGKSAVVQNLINGFGFASTEFYVLRTSNNYKINEKLIHCLVRSRKFRSEAKAHMTGAVGQQRVPKQFLESYPLALPPKKEQDEIVRILENITEYETQIKTCIDLENKLNLLQSGILSKAFKGELGTNQSTEKYALELLKETLKEKL